ncbi:uncharacterized protein Tco025E_05477 [Trypanosoma conorhini]|uniref:Uncharacterized protein n=1 Tax=Trypanosoma conorhini TaxID=83891 RepID=A0A422PD39_9TRYP|nr:uncharacterized protein Tco025E_05477 [Trypanosoma conorhini]RNF15613.1 hypothetical protein Tco025E_05477 [Trypanosoma conorhini]
MLGGGIPSNGNSRGGKAVDKAASVAQADVKGALCCCGPQPRVMQAPPPTYAELFPSAGGVPGRVALVPSNCGAAVARPGAALGESTQVGRTGGGALASPPPPPPPYTDAKALPLPPRTATGPPSRKDDASIDVILQRLFLLQDEINSIKCRLGGQSFVAAASDFLGPPHPPVLSPSPPPPPPPSAPTPQKPFGVEEGDAWRRILLSQQEQIGSLSEALCRVLSTLPVVQTTTLGQEIKEPEQTAKGVKSVPAGEMKGHTNEEAHNGARQMCQDASVGSLEGATVDLMHLLTTLYNLPVFSCGCCHDHLHSAFGEELVAATLGITTQDLLERFASFLVLHLNERYAIAESNREGHTSVDLSVQQSGGLTQKALAPLPLPVIQSVLERTQFPSEIPAYQLAFYACDVYHQRHPAKLTTLSSFKSLSTSCVASSSVSCISSRHCDEEAEIFFHGVRFLWLPLHFLEKELRRCEGLGLVTEACHCGIYSGLLLRLRQAIQAKRCLKELKTTPAQPVPAAFTAKPFLTELNRVRSSYEFLTSAEKKQLVAGRKMDFIQCWRLQKRCDASM